MLFLKLFSVGSIYLIITPFIYAQNNCPQVLKKAQSTYDEGRISEVYNLLEPCLKAKNGFSKEEKIEAYKLLIFTWLYFNERIKAEECMLQFLTLNPEYKLNEIIDPPEFKNLYINFRTTPILIYGFKFGLNTQKINIIRNFSVDNSMSTLGKYSYALGLQVGINVEIPLQKKWSLLTELNLVSKKYNYSDKVLGFAKIKFKEKQTLIESPFFFQFNITKKNFSPYIVAGGAFSFLLWDNALASRTDHLTTTMLEVSGPELKIVSLRHRLLYSASVGVGFKWKNVIGNSYMILDLRYYKGLKNLVKSENRHSNSDLVFDYLHLDDDFKMNSIVLSIGYSLPYYRPILKKNKA